MDGDVRCAAQILGSLGGKALVRKRPGFHREIGHLGGVATAQAHPGMASIWGRLGGRPRRKRYVGEKVISTKEDREPAR